MRWFCLLIGLIVLSACSDAQQTPVPAPQAASPGISQTAQAPDQPAAFVNRLWQVETSSGVAPGTLYAFLTEGTVLITSPNSRPALGSWKLDNGRLILIEEGISYPVDITELNAARFSIRVHNPGEPTTITFVPADAPLGLVAPVRTY